MSHEPEPLDSLGRALRALPDIPAPRDGWERLRRTLEPRRTRPAPWALAAMGLFVVACAAFWWTRHPPATGVADAPIDAMPLAHDPLEARSRELERLLAEVPPTHALRASTGDTIALLEERIAVVDDALSTGELDDRATTDALRRQRIVLLGSLVRVRTAASIERSL
jgi:hypothetical protein